MKRGSARSVGRERKGKERKGKERKVQERKGKERKVKERKKGRLDRAGRGSDGGYTVEEGSASVV